MGARTMFSKFKSGGAASTPVAPNALESNPIWNHFEVGKQSATAGPENVWRILEGYRKSDGKVVFSPLVCIYMKKLNTRLCCRAYSDFLSPPVYATASVIGC